MVYEKILRLPSSTLSRINYWLRTEPSCEEYCFGEDEYIQRSAYFEDGTEMVIMCCGVQYVEGDSNTAWTQAVLWRNGRQIAFSEPAAEFVGEWTLEDCNGNKYVAIVIEGS